MLRRHTYFYLTVFSFKSWRACALIIIIDVLGHTSWTVHARIAGARVLLKMNKLSFAWSNINDSLFIKQLYQSTVCDWWTLWWYKIREHGLMKVLPNVYSRLSLATNNAINSVHTIPLTTSFFSCQLQKLKQIKLHLPEHWNGWKSGCRWICLSCYTCLMEAVHITVFHWHQEMQPGYKRNMKWFPNRQIHTRCPFGQVVSRFSWCWGKQTLYARSWREKHLQEILVGFPRKEIESRFDFTFQVQRKLPPSYIVQKVYFCVEEMSQSNSKLFSAMLFKDF